MSGGKAFFDTNVLLYLYSTADATKQARAQEVFERYDERDIVLSTQVIQEFYAAGSRKLAFSRQYLREAVEKFLALPLVVLGPLQIMKAIENEEQYQISFWDALIIAAAEAGGADILFTEGLNHGQRYGRVLAQNPFLPAAPTAGKSYSE
jgi:predicted nucleic acid-binding protein